MGGRSFLPPLHIVYAGQNISCGYILTCIDNMQVRIYLVDIVNPLRRVFVGVSLEPIEKQVNQVQFGRVVLSENTPTFTGFSKPRVHKRQGGLGFDFLNPRQVRQNFFHQRPKAFEPLYLCRLGVVPIVTRLLLILVIYVTTYSKPLENVCVSLDDGEVSVDYRATRDFPSPPMLV